MKINKNSLIYMMSLFPILVSQVVYTIINSKFAIFLLVLKMFVFIYYFGKKVIRHYISVDNDPSDLCNPQSPNTSLNGSNQIFLFKKVLKRIIAE